MKKVEPWKLWVVVGALVLTAYVVNNIPIRSDPEPHREFHKVITDAPTQNVVQPVSSSSTQQQLPTVSTAPVRPVEVPAPKFWPGDFAPTRIIRIPELEHPSSGIMDMVFQPGDDVEFKIEPLWKLTEPGLPNAMEVRRDSIDLNQSRSWRFRWPKGANEKMSLRFLVDHTTPKVRKPLPTVPTQQFGNLLVDFRHLQTINSNSRIVVDFDFKNMSASSTIAVAFHGKQDVLDVYLRGSLLLGQSQYECQKFAGIKGMDFNPRHLTPLGPGETRHITLEYRTFDSYQGTDPSCRLQEEIILNDDYKENAYDGYQSKVGNLPPGCKMVSMVFDIPIAWKHRDE